LQTVVSAGLKRGMPAEAAAAPASPTAELTATNVASTQTERVRMGDLSLGSLAGTIGLPGGQLR
jgi:hypothetical protein